MPAAEAPYAGEAAATLAAGLWLRGDRDRAADLARRALARGTATPLAGTMLRRVLGREARAGGDRELAAQLHREAADLAGRSGIPTMADECAVLLAQDLAALGDPDGALALVRRAAATAREHDSVLNELRARTAEAAILLDVGDPSASAVADAAAALADRLNQPYGIQTLAWAHLRGGSPLAAAPLALRVLDAAGRLGNDGPGPALDLASATLRAAGRPAWAEVAAAATHSSGRADAARLARRELAMIVDPASPGAMPAREDEAALRRTGDVWEITFGATRVHVKDSKGLRDLAALLRRPGTEVHCLDLAGAAVVEADAGETIDAEARRRYEQRVRELQADIDEAESDNDLGRADAARLELDAIVDHLTAVLGLGGRARREGGTTSRARSAVTHRLRAAIRRIGELHPDLGEHLERSVHTGIRCSYSPDPPVTWLVEDHGA